MLKILYRTAKPYLDGLLLAFYQVELEDGPGADDRRHAPSGIRPRLPRRLA